MAGRVGGADTGPLYERATELRVPRLYKAALFCISHKTDGEEHLQHGD